MRPKVPASRLPEIVAELEEYASQAGWDQPARLFALVETDEIIAGEPTIATALGLTPGGITPVEQDEFDVHAPLDDALASIAWPEKVHGAALVLERVLLPPEAERDLPDGGDTDALISAVEADPRRQEVRIVVAVNPVGDHFCVLRLRSHPDELLTGQDLVPQLAEALSSTFE
jgi:hypothetical protein